MELDTRLKKLAQGVSAKTALEAHRKRTVGTAELDAAEVALADEFEATVEAMFLMAAVDGEVAADELEHLAASIQAISDMQAVEGLEFQPTLIALSEKLAQDGWKARIDSVAERILTAEAKEFAFRLAAGVAFVDDHVAHAEAAAIDALAAAFELDAEASQAILRDVVETLFGDA